MTIDIDKLSEHGFANLLENGLHLDKGSFIRIQIYGNPTTGYEWDYTEESTKDLFDVCGYY